MKAEINENINKKLKWLTFSISQEKSRVLHEKFQGKYCMTNFIKFLKNTEDLLDSVEQLSCFRNNEKISYIKYFQNIKLLNIRGGKMPLEFPRLVCFKNLTKIYINDQLKPTVLKNINTAPKLLELYVGNFTFGKPVELLNFENILKCKNIEKLYFSNAKYKDTELDKLVNLKTLKRLTINQKIEFNRLAELSILLPNIECNEFKAWQPCLTEKGDIKINGKGKPYLNSQTDKLKIIKYENEFNKLRKIYAE